MACGALLAIAGSEANAHLDFQDATRIQFDPDRVQVAVTVSLGDLLAARHTAEQHAEFLRGQFHFSLGESLLSAGPVRTTPPEAIRAPEETFYRYEFDYPLSGRTPASVGFYRDPSVGSPHVLGSIGDLADIVRIRRWNSRAFVTRLIPAGRRVELPTGFLALAAAASLADSAAGSAPASAGRAAESLSRTGRPPQAEAFIPFAPKVGLRWDERFLFIESNGLPAHGMMIGITAWQQQVPLPQSYFGENAWRIPLNPVPAKASQTIRNHFLRGAIAIAADGIPIFNPQNNRGEISNEIGELDRWGGHCGRSDDYHYHVVPLYLQSIVGAGKPLAYALDGYPIYGLTEPDGSPVGKLDENNGHSAPGLGYHYHASNKYPYVIGGFHGEVVERGGQVDPQPRARSVRPAQPPLRGARIIGFTASEDERKFTLQYTLNGQTGSVNYSSQGGNAWKFQFIGGDGSERETTYSGSDGQRPQPPDAPDSGNRPPRPRPQRAQAGAAAADYVPKRTGSLVLHSSAVADGGELPKDYTGDGTGATPPLDWSGTPSGTKAYAVIMHHIDPEGLVKWYWTLYNIPSEVQSLPRNVAGVGTLGTNSINDRIGYAPPHSQGPGPKTYVITLYALSAPVKIDRNPEDVNRAVLLAAIKDLILDSAELRVVYTRPDAPGGRRANRRGATPDEMPLP